MKSVDYYFYIKHMLNNNVFGTNIFDYIDVDLNVETYEPISSDTLNKLVDEVNKREEPLFVNHIRRCIRELDSVYQQINKIYDNTIIHDKDSKMSGSFITDFPTILKFSTIEQQKYDLVDLINEYRELKLIVQRLTFSRPKIPYVDSKQAIEFNVINYVKRNCLKDNESYDNIMNQVSSMNK